MADSIRSSAYQQLRATLKHQWRTANTPCGICGLPTINWDGPPNDPDSFELDHRISRRRADALGRPDLHLDPTNMGPSHSRCNRAKGAGDAPTPMGENTEDW